MQLAVLGGSQLLGGMSLFKATVLGASIAGSMILNGNKKPQGKVNDVRVSSSSYGRGIPKVWGTMRVTGNCFWATDFREEKVYMTQKGKEKTGTKGKMKGKKGKAQPVYKYYANFAMGLAEGPIDDVLRIWADNNLIYNKLNPDDDHIVNVGFSRNNEDEDSGKGSQKSGAGKKGSGGNSGRFAFRFYNGSDSQKPDPFMESSRGEGQACPAYRDLAYLMFENFAVGDFGNRIPTITAEVTSKSVGSNMIKVFENMPPPPGGWYRGSSGPVQMQWANLCLVRNEFMSLGRRDSDRHIIWRFWNMDTRKEVRRIDFTGMLPQTCPHGQSEVINKLPIYKQTHTWGPDLAEDGFYGTTNNGDVCLQPPRGNYGPVVFVDPASGSLIKSWGVMGNILSDPYEGIFVPGGMFTTIGQGMDGQPETYNLIYETFGRIHIFNGEYNKVGVIHCGGRRTNYRTGAYGTKQAIFFTSTDYAGTSQFHFYSAPVEGPRMEVQPGDTMPTLTSSVASEIHFASWPSVAGSKGNTLVIHHMAYVAGVKAFCFIAGDVTASPYLVKMDPETGKVLWEKQIPGLGGPPGGFRGPSQYINTNSWNWFYGNRFVKVDWFNETVVIQPNERGVDRPAEYLGSYYWSERDAIITATTQTSDGYAAPVIIYQDRKKQAGVSLQKVAEDVAQAVGIDLSKINATDLATQEELNGYMYENPTEARQVLEELAQVYQFDCIEIDGMLVFKMRGQNSIKTIPEVMLGLVEGDTENQRLVETVQNQLELPERVSVTYFDPKNDYESGQQYFKRPTRPIPVASTREHYEVTFNMALLNDNAKSMAKRILYAAWSERTSYEFVLPRDYLTLDPSDVITLSLKDGRSIDCRITDITMGANLELQITAVNQLADSYRHNAVTAPPEGVVTQPGGSTYFAAPHIMDIPYIEDSHEETATNLGYYWAALAWNPGFNFGILQSSFEGSDWATEGMTQLDALWGYTKNVVPKPARGWNIEDDLTQITLIPGFDWNAAGTVFTWESIPDDQWPSDKNMIVIGEEVILFKDVVENADKTVTISRLIRGYRGSIDAAYAHTTGNNKWVLMNENAVKLASEDLTYLNKQQKYIINTGNLFSQYVGAKNLELKGGTERPLPPGDLRRVNNADGSVTFRWSYSTRVGGSLKSGTGSVPVGEDSLQFVFFLLKQPYDATTWDPDKASLWAYKSDILTSGQINVTNTILSAAGLTNKHDLHIVIHQISASVGWGFPLGAKIPYALIGV